MTLDLLLLAIGIAMLLFGGDLLVRGASAIARTLGISPLVIGLTIVAFGTSAPELAVNARAAASGNGGITFGNVFGSNMANIGLILGIAAMLQPMRVQRALIGRDIPLMLLGTAVASVSALPGLLLERGSFISRFEAAVLIGLMILFVALTTHAALTDRNSAKELEATVGKGSSNVPMNLLLVAAGLGLLVFGGEMTVVRATNVARTFGVSEVIIGLTLIAVGTSLPELATSLMALRQKQTDIAVGNVVGSNIFNLLFVLSISAAIRPIDVPEGAISDLIANGLLSFSIFVVAIVSARRINRVHGLILLLSYISYMIWRAFLA